MNDKPDLPVEEDDDAPTEREIVWVRGPVSPKMKRKLMSENKKIMNAAFKPTKSTKEIRGDLAPAAPKRGKKAAD